MRFSRYSLSAVIEVRNAFSNIGYRFKGNLDDDMIDDIIIEKTVWYCKLKMGKSRAFCHPEYVKLQMRFR